MPRMLSIILLALPVCQVSLAENIFHFIHFNDKSDLLLQPLFLHVMLFCSHSGHLHFFSPMSALCFLL